MGDDSAQGQGVIHDLIAIKRLYKVRTMDFSNIKLQLEKPMQVDNQPQALQL